MKSVEKMKDKKEMVLYHGSGNNYDNPTLKYSRKDIDFGKCYYLTPSLITAKKWACTKEEAYIYKYKLNIEINHQMIIKNMMF